MSTSVQKTVWDWQGSSSRNAAKTTMTMLRRQAVIQTVIMTAIGFILSQWLGHVVFARVVWGLAAVVLILGLALPRVYSFVHRFGQWLGRNFGALLTWVLLTPLYLIVFFPVAIVLRLRGRDPMNRRMLAPEYTCWIPRRTRPTTDSYARQFFVEDAAARELLRPVNAVGWQPIKNGSSEEVQG